MNQTTKDQIDHLYLKMIAVSEELSEEIGKRTLVSQILADVYMNGSEAKVFYNKHEVIFNQIQELKKQL
jgi:hypothetical protein